MNCLGKNLCYWKKASWLKHKIGQSRKEKVCEEIGIDVFCSAKSLKIVLDLRNYQSKPKIDGTIFGKEDIFTRQFFAMLS